MSVIAENRVDEDVRIAVSEVDRSLIRLSLERSISQRLGAASEFAATLFEMPSGRGQINLSTTLGPLDPLCELEEGVGYSELLSHSEIVEEGP